MTQATVLTAQDDSVFTLTFNRPQAMNALTAAFYCDLTSALMQAADPAVRAVIVTGAGRGFCPGQDLNDSASDDPAADLRFVDGTVRALRALQKPVIAAINGAAAGGGLAYALACDIRIASSSAKFAPAFIDLGLVPDLGCSWLLTQILGADRAFEWLSSGRKITAAEALAMGLVHEVVEPGDLTARAMARAQALAARPTRALGLTKRLLQSAATNSFEAQLDAEAQAQSLAGSSADYTEALAAFRERRPPVFTGR
jgi:2-(1,2-epoxy-1,2-dihydrophenyl)acetyl-CoA isomerase